MKIKLLEAKSYPLRPFPFEGTLQLDKFMLNGDTPLKSVSYRGEYRYDAGNVTFDGRAEVELASECDRCGKPIQFKVSARLNDCFKSDSEGVEDDDYHYSDDEIDLDEYVKDKIVLALPMQKLCGKNCLGLCPQCGTNLNEKTCHCVREDSESQRKVNPFDVLKQL